MISTVITDVSDIFLFSHVFLQIFHYYRHLWCLGSVKIIYKKNTIDLLIEYCSADTTAKQIANIVETISSLLLSFMVICKKYFPMK